MPEISDKQREELCKLRDDFLESLRDFIDSQIVIGDVKTIRRLIATNSRFFGNLVKKRRRK